MEIFSRVRNLSVCHVFRGGILKKSCWKESKKILRQFTNTPLKGVSVGIVITAILQSSSVVSLMVLAFVGAGIIQLKNAIAIIFGTNLGTTFTGWIVVWIGFGIDIESFALPLIAIGGIGLILFSKFEKIHQSGRFLMGFGLLFLGLEYMKLSIGTLAETYCGTSAKMELNSYFSK
ncbi:MAG: Na/Pi symporter [Crocinitomix sp.]|nr:Na/Pi symporter [Crocinitomix sp.]